MQLAAKSVLVSQVWWAQIISDDAATLIHTTSRGYPRAVNNLAIQALVATYAAGKAIVDEQAARAAVTEITDT